MSLRKQKLHIRAFLGILVISLILATVPVVSASEASGTCGADLTWTVSEETLTIVGSGAMTDFREPEMAPWYPYREEVTTLVLPEGLTNVGDLAFFEFKYLEVIQLPSTVERVGRYAFAHCENVRMLTLSPVLKEVEDGAFSDCWKLTSLRLPDGLQTIGTKGFYRCEAITSVTVPASVTEIGVSAFGYCKSLVSADVRAAIKVLPEYCFYGCGLLTSVSLPEKLEGVESFSFSQCQSLATIYYGGGTASVEDIMEELDRTEEDFSQSVTITEEVSPDSASASTVQNNGDGTFTQQEITVTEGENASVTTTVEYTHPETTLEGGSFSADVRVTVENQDGWEEAKNTVSESIARVEKEYSVDGVAPKVDVTVYVKNADAVDQGFVDALSGKDTKLTVLTQSGSDWSIDCTQLEQGALEDAVDFSYVCSVASQEIRDELAGTSAYVLRFSKNSRVNAEVMIKLSRQHAIQIASLYQRIKGEMQPLQSVVIDADGCAHFYLGEVSNEVDYFIGINVPGTQEEAIIPDSLQEEYGIDYAEPIQYVITGRKSSWGIGIGTVTWILAAVMIGTIAGVGVVMYTLNKRKLKKGYIPDISEEE